jgi:hypothetical protein
VLESRCCSSAGCKQVRRCGFGNLLVVCSLPFVVSGQVATAAQLSKGWQGCALSQRPQIKPCAAHGAFPLYFAGRWPSPKCCSASKRVEDPWIPDSPSCLAPALPAALSCGTVTTSGTAKLAECTGDLDFECSKQVYTFAAMAVCLSHHIAAD